MRTVFRSVDEYISTFPEDIQLLLEKVRNTIREKAAEAIEGIAYGMPAYKTNGRPLVYFAGFKNHIGFFALPTGHAAFINELSKYKNGKGSVQFPYHQQIPFDLIGQIVEFRVEENKLKPKK